MKHCKIFLILTFAIFSPLISSADDIFSTLSDMQLHGFISQGFVWSKTHNFLFDELNHGSFEFNELGVTVSKHISDSLHLGIQFFSRDQGDVGNNNLMIDWAYADYHPEDFLGMRLGKLKMPMGLYNDTRDIDLLRTCIFLPQSTYLEYYRDVLSGLHGIGFYGTKSFDSGGGIEYQIQTGTLKIGNQGGVNTLLENEANVETHPLMKINSFSVNQCLNGLFAINPYPGIRMGSSFIKTATKISADLNFDFLKIYANEKDYAELFYKGLIDPETALKDRVEKGTLAMLAGAPLNAEVNNVLAHTHSLELSVDQLLIMLEYYHYTYDIYIALPNGVSLFDDNFFTEGYYANIVYRFNEKFETGIYYSCLYDNARDKNGDRFEKMGEQRHQAWLKDIALSFRFDVNENWTIKLENHWMDGTAFLMYANNPEKRHGLGRYWQMFAAKMTFHF
ncbi:conserved hypothetical protein, secreted [Candidatus Magnetomorum sp. HK-1]|nr:conserved hypothetical protein, secreted [Candidatus Magnetomorum sp. HK-1]